MPPPGGHWPVDGGWSAAGVHRLSTRRETSRRRTGSLAWVVQGGRGGGGSWDG
jgi:hypothetical protein